MIALSVAVAWGQPEVSDEVIVYGELRVEQARQAVVDQLTDLGFDHQVLDQGDHVVYRHRSPWHGEVVLYDDGWMKVKRQPLRVEGAEVPWAKLNSPLAWAGCLIYPWACLRVNGALVSTRKWRGSESRTVASLQPDVEVWGDRIADLAVDRKVGDLPEHLAILWTEGIGLSGEPLPTYRQRRAALLDYLGQPHRHRVGRDRASVGGGVLPGGGAAQRSSVHGGRASGLQRRSAPTLRRRPLRPVTRPAIPKVVALWRLARPSGMPLVLALPLAGFGFGHWEWGLPLRNPTGLAWVLIAWWFLSAGTLWLNAALDRDEGEVLMGSAAPIPDDITRWGYAALVVSVLAAAVAGPAPGSCGAVAAVLAVLYSHPATAWKGHPILGPATNVVGYGLLSPIAGWTLVSSVPTIRTGPTLLLSATWIAGTYFGAQAFQQAEDAARGYRTLVVTHGPATVIRLVRWLYGGTFWTAMALAAVGMYPRLILGVIPSWFVLDRHLARWAEEPGGGDIRWGAADAGAGLRPGAGPDVRHHGAARVARAPRGAPRGPGHRLAPGPGVVPVSGPDPMGTPRALWILARPRLLPHVVLLPAMGFAWAHWDRALSIRGAAPLGGVLVAWAALHAGTLWLNAAVDQDEGEVLLGRSVPPPPSTSLAGYAALAVAVAFAVASHPLSGLAAALSALLSVAYSHPAIFLKAHPVGGPLVNLIGYGLLSPLAGWATVGVAPNPRTAVVWVLGGLGILGSYFAAQAFQQAEDAERGYRTLVATHGPVVVLRAARLCIGVAFAGGVLLGLLGWIPRLCLFASVGWWFVDRLLLDWSRQPGGGNEAWARKFARRMMWTVLAGIVLAFVEYAEASFAGRPVAGLGTVAGHPTDRPRLPAAQLLRWEQTLR